MGCWDSIRSGQMVETRPPVGIETCLSQMYWKSQHVPALVALYVQMDTKIAVMECVQSLVEKRANNEEGNRNMSMGLLSILRTYLAVVRVTSLLLRC